MQKGKKFENFVHDIERILNSNPCTKVEKDVHIKTANGTVRQIDVLLTHQVDRHIYKTVIECKDWKRKIDIGIIEGFSNKLKAVGGIHGIIVSKNGFTAGALNEGKKYSDISLYAIEELDKLQNEILRKCSIGFFKIAYSSNDWTVKFVDKEVINSEMKLYSKLKFYESDDPFDITKIAQDFLSRNQNFLIQKVVDIEGVDRVSTNVEISIEIDFPYPAFFQVDSLKTYITGFRSIIKANLIVNKLEAEGAYKYQNLSQNKTVAVLLEVKLDDRTKQLILKD